MKNDKQNSSDRMAAEEARRLLGNVAVLMVLDAPLNEILEGDNTLAVRLALHDGAAAPDVFIK